MSEPSSFPQVHHTRPSESQCPHVPHVVYKDFTKITERLTVNEIFLLLSLSCGHFLNITS